MLQTILYFAAYYFTGGKTIQQRDYIKIRPNYFNKSTVIKDSSQSEISTSDVRLQSNRTSFQKSRQNEAIEKKKASHCHSSL
jgi:hypothetical protein